jgi:bacillithiol biosynthesis cysteine-adding enzyme BshC
MHVHRLPLRDTKSFTPFFLDYVSQKKELTPFYHRFPVIENFEKQMTEKSAAFPAAHRLVLHQALRQQYGTRTVDAAVTTNVDLLKAPTTFTVTTGHQLNIFTGPLYFIYKIVTVVNACRQLKARYPHFDFVPVYWMASEDHDYDEIKYFRLLGQKITWTTEQHGAVGRFSTEGLAAIARELPAAAQFFAEAYSQNKTLAAAVRQYVTHLFGKDGLVVVDGDDAALKQLLAPVLEQELFHQRSHALVEKQNKALEQLGYSAQVFSRPINLFYLNDGVRARLEQQGDVFRVVDYSLRFSEAEIRAELAAHPERFSPNVILRPLYQEIILPNLAYCGGPAEMIYWLQLKGVFDYFQVPFPVLLPRNFALVLPGPVAHKWEKTGMTWADLFEEKNYLHNQWTIRNSGLALTLSAELTAGRALFEGVQQRAAEIDRTLVRMVAAESKRALDSLEKIEHKFLRAAKRKQQEKLQQIDAVKDFLFPNGSLQERTDSFLNFYLEDADFLDRLRAHLEPFDFRFTLIHYA